jgi:topoisomerase-4 subunit A
MLLLQLSELRYMAKGRGLILMGLDSGEKLLAVLVTDRPALAVSGTARGKPKEKLIEGEALGHYAGHRANKGRVLPDKLKPTALKAG